MCNHSNTVKIGDTKVCLKCGMVRTWDGKVFYDKEIVNYKPKKKKRRK